MAQTVSRCAKSIKSIPLELKLKLLWQKLGRPGHYHRKLDFVDMCVGLSLIDLMNFPCPKTI